MANRRMFSLDVVETDRFLDMPISSQGLYFHLGLRADDEGFVGNSRQIQRSIGCSEDDLGALISNDYIISFDSGVVVIKHWKTHNYIRGDRLHPTKYRDELRQLSLDENGSYVRNVSLLPDACQANVGQLIDISNENKIVPRWVEVGDGIIAQTGDDVIETFVFNRTTKGIQGMMDTIVAKGNETREEIFGVNKQIIQLQGKTAVITKNVDEVSVKLTDLAQHTEAQFKITAESITSEVTRATTAEGQLSSKITQNAEQISLKVSKGNISSELSVESGQVKITGNRLIVESTNFKLNEKGDATFGGTITSAAITGQGLEAGDNFWVNYNGSIGDYEIGLGGFSITERNRNSVFSDMVDDTVGMADGGKVRLWIGGNYDNPNTFFDENGFMTADDIYLRDTGYSSKWTVAACILDIYDEINSLWNSID